MKLIEALKLTKELTVKAGDLRTKIAQHSAHLSIETPVYPNQTEQVSGWLQSHEDITREIARLNVCIARTNIQTWVPIKIGENLLSKTITEWIVRRRTLAAFDLLAWQCLTDRGLKEGQVPSSTTGGQPNLVKIVRCYDPVQRDRRIVLYKEEPGLIDRNLEVINAITDLLE